MGNINAVIAQQQDEDDEMSQHQSAVPAPEGKPLSIDDNMELVSELQNHTCCALPKSPSVNLATMLRNRQLGWLTPTGPMSTVNGSLWKVHAAQRFVPRPDAGSVLLNYNYRIFCGAFSPDGSIFMSATQDRKIRFYNTSNWNTERVVRAREVGWSILGTDYSADQKWLIYSGWSDAVHLTNVTGEHQQHEALDFNKENYYFCLFSVKFSPDSNEILGGSSDKCLYVYDLSRKDVVMRVKAHDHDINTVAYGETDNNNLMFSAGDDCLIKVWDRRTLGNNQDPIGLLVGHTQGITHVAPKGDGVYLISNGKDQTLKLWDIRKMDTNISHTTRYSKKSGDYRYGVLRSSPHPNDLSVATFTGHEVTKTLIRCNFSPMASTGQKYIYTGSSDGSIYIFDLVTGKIISTLKGHYGIVRDLSWHPYQPYLVSTSWDGSMGKWESREPSSGKVFSGAENADFFDE